MNTEGRMQAGGTLGLEVIRGMGAVEVPQRELTVPEMARFALPQPDQTRDVQEWKTRNFGNFWRGARRVMWHRATPKSMRMPAAYGALYLKVIRGGRLDGVHDEIDLGLVSLRVVTTAGVNYLASCFDNTAEPELFKFHGFGTGTTAEASGDTALVTELTTEYSVDSTRPTGTQAHSTNTYTTVGTLVTDSGTPAVTEHGVFSATSAGTLWDRTKFAAINLVGANGDGIVATYVATFPAGG